MFISLLLTTILNTASAVPLQLTQQGRVLDNNGSAVSGIQDLTLSIYDASTAGSMYWSETLTVNFTNGYYAAVLGSDEVNNPLDSSTLALHPLYLEIQLNNNSPMTTRYAINSAPYAQMAGTSEVAESVDGGVVNASEVQINSSQVIDGSGNWVGQPITVDWNNIDQTTIPSYITDGDDNTQLSETQVEGFITNGSINLAAGSQMNSNDLVTTATDSDTLANLSCSTAEIAGWSGSAWTCVSDNTLSVSDVTTMLANNAVDLNAATTIGGLAIITEMDDADTLAGLSCANDGEIARYDLAFDEWYCDADIDTVLDENTVETYVTNGALDLDANTTIGGNPILTSTTDSDVLAALGCSDGQVAKYDTSNGAWTCGSDDNTQLSQSEVISNITGQQVSLGAGSTVGGADILINPNGCSDAQVLVYDATNTAWVCGDDNDTTLTPTEMQAMIEVMSLNLQNLPQVNGADVLTTGSSIDVTQLDGTSGSSGQVLTTDGSTVSWEAAGGSGNYFLGDITFTSSSAMAYFCQNYTGIYGDVTITGNVANVDDLTCVTFIEGGLEISSSSLTNVDGLNSLTTITGSLTIFSNEQLTNIDGLINLTTLGADSSSNVSISMYSNTLLESLSGLNGVTTIDGHLEISSPILQSIDLDLTEVGGNVVISDASFTTVGLQSLISVGGDFRISSTSVTDISLNQLVSVGGTLWVKYNSLLGNISGLNSLVTVDRIEIFQNFSTSTTCSSGDLSGFNSLQFVTNGIQIGYNCSTSISGFTSLISSGDINISDNSQLLGITGFLNVTTAGELYIGSNAQLLDITGFTSISSVRSFYIASNEYLMDITSTFTNLGNVDQTFYVEHNYNLPQSQVNALLNSIGTQNIGGQIYTSNNN